MFKTVPFNLIYAQPSRNGLTKPKAIRGTGTKIVNMGELYAHPRMRNIIADKAPLTPREKEAFLLEKDDLLFARQSLVPEGAGKCSIFLGDIEEVTFESHIIRVRIDKEKADPGYYYYYFRSNNGREVIESIIEQGAGVAGIRASDLSCLEVLSPTLPEQRAIAQILSSLDDKIAMNKQMSETMEALAQALFKSWFIDFDPVRAKMDGRCPNLPKNIADLFPAIFVESELGEIPTGWQMGTLGDVLSQRVERCVASAETEAQPYVPIDCIAPKSLLLPESKPGKSAQSSLTKFYKGDLLFGAMRPYFHKVCIAPFDGTTRTTAFVLFPRQATDFAYASLLLHHPSTVDYATRHSTGSTIPYAVWRHSLEDMPVIIPPNDVRLVYNNIVGPILTRIVALYFENSTLAALRDALLPGLVSGDLKVKDAEKFVGRAV